MLSWWSPSAQVSPKSKGLFQAAIMESGTVDVTFFFQPLAQAKAYYEDLAARWGRWELDELLDALLKYRILWEIFWNAFENNIHCAFYNHEYPANSELW